MEEQRMNCRAFLMKPRLGVELGVEALPKKRAEGRRAAASTRTSKRGSRRFPTIWHACAGFENVRLRIAQKKAAANDDCGRWRRVTTLHASRRHPRLFFCWRAFGKEGRDPGAAVGPSFDFQTPPLGAMPFSARSCREGLLRLRLRLHLSHCSHSPTCRLACHRLVAIMLAILHLNSILS